MIRRFLKLYYGKRNAVKKYEYFDKVLSYQAGQHLTFAFKNSIIYEDDIQKKLSKIIKPNSLVFDIGSNIGQYAMPFADLVGDKGKVVCYEPDIDNFKMLQSNVILNNLLNVTLNNKGVSNENGILMLYKDNETGGRTSSFDKSFNPNFKNQAIEVEVTTLINEIEKYGEPNLIKIDVEGFEYKIIEGLLEKDINSEFIIEVRKETKSDVFNSIISKGYRCFNLDTPSNDPLEFEFKEVEEVLDFCNLYFKKIVN